MIRSRRLRGALFALLATSIGLAFAAGPAQAEFGIQKFAGSLVEAEVAAGKAGTPLLAAGAHPDFTTTLELNVRPTEGTKKAPDENAREFIGYGPPGLVGNPTVSPRCSFTELQGAGTAALCLPETQVGRVGAILYTGGSRFEQPYPVYNMVPPPGVPAEFGVNVAGVLIFIDASVVNRGGQYSIALESHNVSEGLPLGGFRLTLWGVPASAVHDKVRAVGGGAKNAAGEVPSAAPELPFISNPTACSGAPLTFGATASSWQGSSATATPFSSDEGGNPLLIGACANVPFEPGFTAQPTTSAADSPTGLDVTVTIPQTDTPSGIASSHLRDATVRLPAGMSINPASAAGLGACTAAAANLGGEAPAACPQDSKLGTVEIDTPLLESPLTGDVYLARQRDNKFDSLLALYLTVDDPATGIVLKLPGKIEAVADGQVTASFAENPQLPFETLRVKLFGGPQAPLRTPSACGTYTTAATFTPWSGGPAVNQTSSFQISGGPGGSGCPNGGFDPGFTAGTANPIAGAYSPFSLEISRGDGTRELASLTATLPEGLLGKLAGVSYCPDAALAGISTAEGTGAAQLASPACPAASLVGRVSVTAGAGPSPFEVATGRAYLAGPYKGAPLSLAIVTPALAGPFDLGNVVVRTALQVDPTTTRITAVSDPLPTVLHGIPLDLRRVRVDLDRPSFTVNPTSCEATAVTAQLAGLGGVGATRASRFQVAECARLGYRPQLALTLSGATRRGGDPALRAVLRPRPGDADSGRVQVLLPRSAFIDQRHIDNPCTRPQFAAESCPANSILGRAVAYSPLLDQPLSGYVYFRANGGERRLPDIVADLRGQIHVVLVGFVDSLHKKGSQSSRVRTTFATVPDAAVSRFELSLKGGKRGLIQNSADLCAGKQIAVMHGVGQNGRIANLRVPVRAASCGGGKR